MTSHCILKRFELVTDTPGNIPLLRRFVIDLAVRGKLIEESSEDEHAAEILKRIAAKKDLLLKDGKIKKQKPLLPIAEGDVPAVYSAHCVFERLANIAMLEKGLTGIQSAQPGQYPLVVTAEVRSSCDHFDFEGAAAIIPMVSSTGHGHASLNRLHYQEGKFALGNILCAVFPISDDLISARFLYEYLTAFKEELLVSKMIGTANVSLTIGKIGEVPVPIVSPTVQQRVDELMALCDRLETAQVERESRRDRLVASSLNRLNKGADPDAFRDYARFYFNCLPHLTTRSEHIQQLRQTILNLAVRGKLVPQDPSEEPATLLMVRLTANAKAYALEQGIAPPNPDPIVKENIDCPAPPGWEWVRLASLFKVITDGDHQPPPKANDGIAFLTIGNITTGKLDFSNCRFVGEKYWKSLSLYRKPAFGDILYTVVGATYGRPAYVDTRRQFCVQRHIAILKPTDKMNVRFLCSLLASPLVYEQAKRSTTGTAQPTIPLRPLRNFLVLLPPLAEQHRIVAKVEELLTLCDRLDAQLTTTQTESRRLLEAVLHEAVAEQSGLHEGVPPS